MICMGQVIELLDKKIPPEDRILWITLVLGAINDLRHLVASTKAKDEVISLINGNDKYLTQMMFCELVYNEVLDGNIEPLSDLFDSYKEYGDFIRLSGSQVKKYVERMKKSADGV